jgi:hypothetical protein
MALCEEIKRCVAESHEVPISQALVSTLVQGITSDCCHIMSLMSIVLSMNTGIRDDSFDLLALVESLGFDEK